MNETLFYFTNSYPYGRAENWKRNELHVLKDYFKKIHIIPFHYGPSEEFKGYEHERIQYHVPLFPSATKKSLTRQFFTFIFSRWSFSFLREALRKTVYLSKKKTASWISSSYTIHSLLHHPKISRLIASADQRLSVFYFFWGRESAEMIPFMPRQFKIACRFHSYDLYEEEFGGYLPYQSIQVKRSNLVLPCSVDGSRYLAARYALPDGKISVARLGVVFRNKLNVVASNVFTVISCSGVVDYKRIHLIALSLSKLMLPLKWVHIGDGPLLNRIMDLCDSLSRSNHFFTYEFVGSLSNDQVFDFYEKNYCDLFINTSSIEGVPVAIMEAMSMGIPVIASDVGGSRELVNDSVGFLFAADASPEEISGLVNQYIAASDDTKSAMRKEAQKIVQENYDAYKNAKELSIQLVNL